MFEGMDAGKLRAVFEAMRAAVHSPSKQAKNWAGKPLKTVGERSDQEATKIVKAWIENGVLIEGDHIVSNNRVSKVTLNEEKAADIIASVTSVTIDPPD